jgi:hypothetical protein
MKRFGQTDTVSLSGNSASGSGSSAPSVKQVTLTGFFHRRPHRRLHLEHDLARLQLSDQGQLLPGRLHGEEWLSGCNAGAESSNVQGAVQLQRRIVAKVL